MTSAMTVFAAGIFGVFLGMSFLYLSIKITARAAAAVEARRPPAKEDK